MWLVDGQKLSQATVNLQLSPIRKLAKEMVDNGLVDSMLARGIENVASSQASPYVIRCSYRQCVTVSSHTGTHWIVYAVTTSNEQRLNVCQG